MGSHFSGWQKQKTLPVEATVQGCLEQVLSRVADRPIQLYCAGRTDAGVHATGQVGHFETEAVRSPHAF